MQKKLRRRSITARITLWFMIVLITIVTLTFLIFRYVSSSILQKTVRGYLLSSVNKNIDKIRFLPDDAAVEAKDNNDIRIRWRDGQLEIDDDFLDMINDVQSALYAGDGTMLYGKNPIGRLMEEEMFSESRIYRYRTDLGEQWFVYDRKLQGKGMEDLWIRGVVSLSSEEMQLSDIFRTAAIFVPVLLILGVAGSWLTVKQALIPVRKIEQTASEITQGTDLERRIEIGDVDSELYDLAMAFNGMLDRLEHSFEAEQQFTSDASHELRTPMAVIMAQTELALERERTPDQYRRALGVISRQSRRMSALIASMLDYTRLEMRPENYPLSEVDMSLLVESTAQDMALIRRKEIKLRTEITGGLRVHGNALLIERALQNLIDNAYKYGRGNGCIQVRLTRGLDKSVRCEVEDDGIGISDADLKHIFERFYRADPSRQKDGPTGAGLGLSMVKKIMEIHSGSVTVSSTPDQGSVFTMIFPGS